MLAQLAHRGYNSVRICGCDRIRCSGIRLEQLWVKASLSNYYQSTVRLNKSAPGTTSPEVRHKSFHSLCANKRHSPCLDNSTRSLNLFSFASAPAFPFSLPTFYSPASPPPTIHWHTTLITHRYPVYLEKKLYASQNIFFYFFCLLLKLFIAFGGR